MLAYEKIQKLAQYPADTDLKLASDWGEPVLDDTYLVLQDEPCLCITNTEQSKAHRSAEIAGGVA